MVCCFNVPVLVYVMVCCFNVPVLVYETPVNIHSVVNLCKELYWTRKEKDDFEMVVVTRMQDDDEEAFNHLLSFFPESCLTIPFEDWKRHEYVCDVLNLTSGDLLKCVFVNAGEKVSPFFSDNNYLDIFKDYEAEAFPFSEEVMKKRIEEYDIMECSNNLEAVLRCNDSSPAYVYKFGDDDSSRLQISQLSNSNKHVGVLLCCKGDLISHLVRSYEQCRKKHLDFEIVVVYTPFSFFGNMDPKVFKKKIDGLLHKHFNTCSHWWCLPFDNSVSRRFWRMSKYYCTSFDRCECDKFIVVGPSVARLDKFSGEMMKYHGIDAYPFTTEAVIANKMNKFREFTLESLFSGTRVYWGTDRRRKFVPVRELRADKVFLLVHKLKGYFDFKTLVPVYHEMKERFGYELIFVDIGYPIIDLLAGSQLVSDEERREIESEMPWYICPANKPLIEFYSMTFAPLLGFGDGRRLCSLSPVGGQTFSLQDFLSGNALYDEVKRLIMSAG